MSVIDDIKDKMGGGNDSSLESDLDSSLGDEDFGGSLGNENQSPGNGQQGSDFGQSSSQGQGRKSPGSQNSPGGQNASNPASSNSPARKANNVNNRSSQHTQDQTTSSRSRGGGQNQNQGQPSGQGNRSRQHQNGRSRSSNNSPNPHSGRPQKGGSTPQVSGSTEKKMQEMMNNSEPQSVSDSRSDIEELKAQNKQIIDLLKRINQNLTR